MISMYFKVLFLLVFSGFCASCQSTVLPHDDTKKPLPLTKDEGSNGLGIALVDEADVDVSSDSRYVPFNPKGLHVYFAVNRTNLDENAKKTLAKVRDGMLRDPLVRIVIRAHTDSTGSPETNLKLSKARAITIKRYLVSRGIGSHRLITDYAGESDTLASNQEEDLAGSRRAEFLIDYTLAD
ncbi:MAG: OmpA family protein [Pseudobacteriovorax sp.]|nr:OmpA family protein [Pseudobacteriovorax sp.]